MQWEDIEIDIPKEPFPFSWDYDKRDIEAIAARAKEQGHAIPKGFIDKLHTDGELTVAGIRARTGTDVGTMYVARADAEMLEYFDSHPFLEEAPEFSQVRTVARFSQGAPVYRVKLCAFIGASEQVVDRKGKRGK